MASERTMVLWLVAQNAPLSDAIAVEAVSTPNPRFFMVWQHIVQAYAALGTVTSFRCHGRRSWKNWTICHHRHRATSCRDHRGHQRISGLDAPCRWHHTSISYEQLHTRPLRSRWGSCCLTCQQWQKQTSLTCSSP